MIRCKWDGATLTPTGHYGLSAACELMDVGDTVIVEVDHPRSQSSHKHQFAEINEAWRHLPEHLQDRKWSKSPEALRKHALIATGYALVEQIVCGTLAEVHRWSRTAERMGDAEAGYCVVEVRGTVVTVIKPESQSMRAMGGKRFQESKTAVLDWIAAQIGVEPEQIRGAA